MQKSLLHKSVDNDVDELKIKFWAHLNNNVNWAAQKYFIQDALVKTCQLPVVQGDTEGSFIPFHKHFSPVLGTILSEQMKIS